MRRRQVKTTERSRQITPFYVMELLEKAKEMEARGEHIVHMEVGEPDFSTPSKVMEKAIDAIRESHTFYTHSLGIPVLRQRIAKNYLEQEGVEVSPDRIIITNGTSGAFLLLFAVLLDSKKVLALSDPGYPCYRNFGLLVGTDIMSVPVSEKTRFEITVDALRRFGRAPDVLIVSTPSNPTGIVYRWKTIETLCSFMADSEGTLIVDEIYKGLIYGKNTKTALTISDDIIVVNGFSKTHAMTGWRLGWMVVPKELVRPIQKVAQNVYISPPSIAQYAALCAFDMPAELKKMRDTYKQRRDFMLPRLKKMGFSIPVDPGGAFYIYAGIGKWGIDSMEFVERALKEAKVALTPGYDFGVYKAGSHIRFSYANSMEMLALGCKRLEAWLENL